MKPHRFAIGLLGIAVAAAAFQVPMTSSGQDSGTATASSAGNSQGLPETPSHVRPQTRYPQSRRSIVQHYPYPYPGYYQSDDAAGFRNPGNVGRYAEYYPPGNVSQLEREHVPAAPPVARFDTNPATNRDEQIRSTQVGIQRYNSIQNHIDNYARPYWGYGFGAGFYGGFW